MGAGLDDDKGGPKPNSLGKFHESYSIVFYRGRTLDSLGKRFPSSGSSLPRPLRQGLSQQAPLENLLASDGRDRIWELLHTKCVPCH